MLNESQLRGLLTLSETRLIERKASKPSTGDIRKFLVAFANSVSETEYAVIFIGVADDGKILGIPNPDEIQRDIRRIADHDCFPPVNCDLQVIRDEGLEIVAVIVPPSTNRPHFTGHCYVRRGSENIKASAQMFEEMIASRNDKTRRILASKGKPISARFNGGRTAVEGPEFSSFPPRDYRSYQIEYCDAHYVRFKDLSTGHIYVHSLDHISIEADPLTNDLRLFVNERP